MKQIMDHKSKQISRGEIDRLKVNRSQSPAGEVIPEEILKTQIEQARLEVKTLL